MSYDIVKRYGESNNPPLVGTKILRYSGRVDGLMRIWHLAELDDNNIIVKTNLEGGLKERKIQKLNTWLLGQEYKNFRIKQGLRLH